MKVLLFGATGQLGKALLGTFGETFAHQGHDVRSAPRSLDIGEGPLVESLIKSLLPDWVINAAAMTDVDGANKAPDLAVRINGLGPAHMSKAADSIGARFIQISTEAVFSGERQSRYEEGDLCEPVSVYGASKLTGETLTRIYSPHSYVLRTSWLYSDGIGTNFPTRLLAQLEAHERPVSVVTDVVGNPTRASVLAQAIWRVIKLPPEPGTYHICSQGAASKYDWAVNIASNAGFNPSRIQPSSSADYPTIARRPKYVDLSCDKYLATGLGALPRWDEGPIDTLVG